MKRKLTDRVIGSLKAPQTGRVEISDGHVPGLVFRVTATGKRSWALRYRDKYKRQFRLTLGGYPDITLAKARQRALEALASNADGIDLRPTEQATTIITFGDLVNEYLTRHVDESLRKPKVVRRMFEMHILPSLRSFRLEEIRRGDVVALLYTLQDKGLKAQVNRIQTAISSVLNWGVDREYLQANPIAGMHKLIKEHSRDRVLSDEELNTVWNATKSLSEPSRQFAQILILTGQRRDEVRCMRWSEINMEKTEWIIPAERTKSNRAHMVPLSGPVMEILSAIERQEGVDYVFTIDGEKPYTGQSKLAQRLIRLCGNMDHFILHDFRRTMRTGLSRLGVQDEIRQRVSNHARGSLESVYEIYDFLKGKRDALDKWADHVVRATGGTDGAMSNVVALR